LAQLNKNASALSDHRVLITLHRRDRSFTDARWIERLSYDSAKALAIGVIAEDFSEIADAVGGK
jgi:uncharacterized protein YegJ (DUF2314 family)